MNEHHIRTFLVCHALQTKGVRLKSTLNSSIPFFCDIREVSGGNQLGPMLLRDVSLSDDCTADRYSNSNLE